MTYFDNDLFIFIIVIDVLFALFIITSIICKMLEISLNESKYELKLLEQIKNIDDNFKKNDNFKFYKNNTDESETYLFISKDGKFVYHELADNYQNLTMLFSSTENNKLNLLIHLDLHSRRLIKVRSTDINYFVNKFDEFGINMNSLQSVNELSNMSKYKFKISDKLASELLVKMRNDLKIIQKSISE